MTPQKNPKLEKEVAYQKRRLQASMQRTYSDRTRGNISAALALLRAIEDIADDGKAAEVLRLAKDLGSRY